MGGDPVVAAGASGEVAPGGIAPEAGEFDMDTFLVDRGYEAPAPAAGEANGVGVIGAVAVSEPVGDGAPGSEPEGVQVISGVDGGGFDDRAFEPVDVEAGMESAAGGGVDQGLGPVFQEPDGAGVAAADEPVGALEGDAGDGGEAVLSDEVNELLVLVAGVPAEVIPGTGVVVVEEGEGETPDLGEVLHILGDGDPLEGGLYAEGGERPLRFGRRRR